MNCPLVVRSRKFEFSTPSAMPLNDTRLAKVVMGEKRLQRLVRDLGIDCHAVLFTLTRKENALRLAAPRERVNLAVRRMRAADRVRGLAAGSLALCVLSWPDTWAQKRIDLFMERVNFAAGSPSKSDHQPVLLLSPLAYAGNRVWKAECCGGANLCGGLIDAHRHDWRRIRRPRYRNLSRRFWTRSGMCRYSSG